LLRGLTSSQLEPIQCQLKVADLASAAKLVPKMITRPPSRCVADYSGQCDWVARCSTGPAHLLLPFN